VSCSRLPTPRPPQPAHVYAPASSSYVWRGLVAEGVLRCRGRSTDAYERALSACIRACRMPRFHLVCCLWPLRHGCERMPTPSSLVTAPRCNGCSLQLELHGMSNTESFACECAERSCNHTRAGDALSLFATMGSRAPRPLQQLLHQPAALRPGAMPRRAPQL
jgi:hypothetical protein